MNSLLSGIDAARPLDLVGALEGVVDAADHGRHRVVGVQRLVRVHGFGGVAVGGDLPAGQVDGLEAGLGLLHRLAG
jgi:hypothetical protein